MKKIFSMLLLMALWQCAIAQTATLSAGGMTNESSLKKTAVARTNYIGATDSSIYLIQYLRRSPKGTYLTRYDKNMVVQARRELTEEEDSRCLGGFVGSEGVELMMAEEGKTTMRTLAQRFDLVTLEPVGEPREMKSLSWGDNGKHDLSVIDAPGGELSAAIYLVQTDGRNAEAQVSLFDNDLEEYWQMDCPVHVLDDAYLSDSGEVVLAGFYVKKDDPRTYFEVTYMDGDRLYSFDFDCDIERVHSMEVVRLAGGRVYVTGSYLSEASTKQKEVFEGIYALTVNMKNKAVERVSKHTLTKEEKECMANMTKIPKNSQVPYAAFFGWAADDKGVTVGYHHAAMLYTNGIPTQSSTGGILLLRINDKGDIVWTRTLNRNAVSDPFMRILARGMMKTSGDKTMVVFADCKYNVGKENASHARIYSPANSTGQLHVAWVSRDGDIRHEYLPMPSKMALVGLPHRVSDNEYNLILASGSKSAVAKLKIEEN